jgi:hypothetical protein
LKPNNKKILFLLPMKDIGTLKEQGFKGFVSFKKLMDDKSVVTKEPGVYIVLREDKSAPSFLEIGTGGFFKGKNPNVTIQELKNNWIDDTQILYIGKATSLQRRLKQYIEFGEGKAVGHWGGRFIWQLKDSQELIVCWHTFESEKVAKATESSLIEKFKSEHQGKRPFANLRD